MNNETTVDSRVYEISFIFDNKLDESAALEKSNALKQSIATLGGSFISEEAPYMRELAYEMIRVVNNVNVRFNEGYFGWIKFNLTPAKVKDLEKALKLDEEVVRYLVVTTVVKTLSIQSVLQLSRQRPSLIMRLTMELQILTSTQQKMLMLLGRLRQKF
jgi:ribosomal protein S6